MHRITGPGSDPRPLSIFLILFVFLAAVTAFLGGCARGGEKSDGMAADSTRVADSTQVAESKSGGFLDRFRKSDEEDKEEERIPVELGVVGRGDVPSYLGATASLEPEKRVTVQSEAMGQIRELRVEEGDFIVAGQVMATLDGEAETLALEEAALRAAARERELRRGEALHAEQGISKKELQDLRFRFDEAEAQRRSAEHRLERTRIIAPFSGRVSERLVDPGQHLGVGIPLFELVDSDPLLARIYLPEKQAVRIALGQSVVIVPDTRPDLELGGEVMRIAPVVDTRTGTVKVTCRIAGEGGLLRPGSFVRVKVQTDLHESVLVVPKRALVPEGGETYVFKAMADSVIKVAVATGYGNGSEVEIVEGLDEGDRIVVVGTGSLKNGSKFKDLGAEGAADADTADLASGEGDES